MSVIADLRAKIANKRARRKQTRERQHELAAREQLLTKQIKEMRADIKRIRKQSQLSIGERAYRVAESCVGIVERGGNNRGADVERIILANGGVIGEPWCGDFVAWCYRQAGSSAPERIWASVRLMSNDPDVHPVSPPRKGDPVRFTFDHVGLFGAEKGPANIETIEGNTTSVGAVSDGAAGTDGVKRKIRAKSLVHDYLRVER